jgi:ABC-type multidrug transport system ATPase subunit
LTKKFGAFKAVDNLNFSIKEGEIFTILGHNGAGKTTAIFMLTGMLTPTSGDATVYGNKLSNNIDGVQQNLGLCQQFDVLFDKLTVQDHLDLVCEIKNIPAAQKAQLIKETLSIVMLTEHQMKLVC